MTIVETCVTVAEDRYMSGVAPEAVSPGEHRVAITVGTAP